MVAFLFSVLISTFSYYGMRDALSCDENPGRQRLFRGFCFFSSVAVLVGYVSCQVYHGRPPEFLRLNLYKSALSKVPVNARTLTLDELAKEVKECDFTERSLRFANLEHANLTYGKLKKVDLTGARLVKTNLTNAGMESAVLVDACLEDTLLCGAVMDGATLPGAFKPAELPKSMQKVIFEGVQFDNLVIDARPLSRFNEKTRLNMRGANFIKTSGNLTLKCVFLHDSRFKDAQFHDDLFREPKGRKLVLQDVDLDRSNFEGAAIKAFFTRVSLVGITGKSANFSGSVFNERCDFAGANLSNVNFISATFQQVRFYQAVLCDAIFDGATLERVSFRMAKLQKARFVRASVIGDFQNADLTDADFSEALLFKSKFHGADLTAANFQGADLHDCTGITKEQWENLVIKDAATIAPLVLE